MKVVTNLDLNTNQLQNFLVHPLAADPSNIAGRFYYNSAAGTLKYYDGIGAQWRTLGVSGSVDVSTATGVLTPSHGGTGVANADAKTITLGGAISTAGTLTVTAGNVSIANGLSTTGTFSSGGNFSTSSTFSVTGALSIGGAFTTSSAFTTTGAFTTSLTQGANLTLTLPAVATATVSYITANPSTNQVPYAGGASGLLSYLALQATAQTGFLSQTSSGAPSWISSTGTAGSNVVLATSPSITTPTLTTPSIATGGTLTSGTFTVNSGATLAIATGGFHTIADAPVNPTDATNKAYVDSMATGVRDFKDSVVAATTANITLAGGAPNTLDGVTLAANSRILVKNQTAAQENGIYYVSTLGTGANGTWTRATDANTSAGVTLGMYLYVEGGSAANKGAWVLSASGATPIVLGTTTLTFTKFSSLSDLTAGNGIDITSNAVSLKVNASTTYTQYAIPYFDTTTSINKLALPTVNNQVLLGLTAGAPFYSKLVLTPPATAATLTLADNSSLITSGAFNTTLTAAASVAHALPNEASKLVFLANATTPAVNQIAYFDATTGRVTGVAVNAGTIKYLSQTSSGVPTWSSPATNKFTQAVTGAGPSYGPYTHGLGSADIVVTVVDDTGAVIVPDIAITSTTITLTYGVGAPTAVTHRLIAMG